MTFDVEVNAARFQPFDPVIFNEAIPAILIGRDKEGF